jgi:hypothetical protein
LLKLNRLIADFAEPEFTNLYNRADVVALISQHDLVGGKSLLEDHFESLLIESEIEEKDTDSSYELD